MLAIQFLITSGKGNNFRLLWEHCSTVLTIFQTLQLIEVGHAAVRLVPSSPIQTFIQILSRLVLVWGVLIPVPESRHSIGVPMLIIAWCIAECTRYFYYGFHLHNAAPYFATWLRYTLFIVLYPLGVSGELFTTYSSLKTISAKKMWSIELPNAFNISFYYDYILIAFMLSYIHCRFLIIIHYLIALLIFEIFSPVFPQLYFFMLAQRKKFLGPNKSEKKSH